MSVPAYRCESGIRCRFHCQIPLFNLVNHVKVENRHRKLKLHMIVLRTFGFVAQLRLELLVSKTEVPSPATFYDNKI